MRQSVEADNVAPKGASENLVIARQPIFDRDTAVFGYELLFRHCDDVACHEIGLDQATTLMIADGFALAASGMDPAKRACINVTSENLLTDEVMALPPERVILEIPAAIEVDQSILDKCRDLKDKGFQLTVDNFRPDPGVLGLLALADYVKIAISDFSGPQVAKMRKDLKRFPCRLIASRIETWEMFAGSKFLNFDYFQGFFFAQAEVLPGRKASTISAVRLKLIKELSKETLDLKRIATTISMDPSLSVRLLKFINSAAFSTLDKVDSISRAIYILGAVPLKRWALAVLLADSDSSDKGRELTLFSLHRAFFLSSLAEAGLVKAAGKESLFLLGLLSSADSLFGMSMEELISGIPLEPYIVDALLLRPGGALTGLMRLLGAIERNDWGTANVILASYGIPTLNAARLYMKASRQAADTLDKMSR